MLQLPRPGGKKIENCEDHSDAEIKSAKPLGHSMLEGRLENQRTFNFFLPSQWTIVSCITQDGLVPTLRWTVPSRKSGHLTRRERGAILRQRIGCVVGTYKKGVTISIVHL